MERIKFREVGDLGIILQKSSQFIRQNFISIIKSALLIVGVPFIIGTYLSATSMSRFYSNFGSNLQDTGSFTNMFGSFKAMLPGYLLISISFMMFYIICIAYIKQYINGVEKIDQSSVIEELKKHFLKVFFGGILITILTYIGAIFCLIPGIYFAVIFSHLFIIAIVEDRGFGQSFSKSFNLIKGNWWNSFLLYLVSTLIVMGISFIVILPTYIYLGVSMFKNNVIDNPEAMMDNMSTMGWFMPIYMAVYLIIIIVVATIQSVNYYNLVEAQEGLGEKKDIENIGN